MKAGCPPRVIGSDVDQYLRIACMNRIHQLDKLFKWCGLRIKLRQGRINRRKTESRIRTSKSSHPRISCRRRVNGQQVQKAAAQPSHDKIQLCNQITERTRLGNYRITSLVEFTNPELLFRMRNGFACLVRTELPDKGIINDICTACMGGSNIENRIGTFRPFRIRVAIFEKKTLSFCMANFGHGKGNLKQLVMNPTHGNIEPVLAKQWNPPFNAIYDFFAADPDMADVGSNPCFAFQRGIQTERKCQNIPSKRHNVVSRQRILPKAVGYCHDWVTTRTLLSVPKQFLQTRSFWGSRRQ